MNFFLDKSAHDIRIAIKLWKAELNLCRPINVKVDTACLNFILCRCWTGGSPSGSRYAL